jgi:hypothetical protein
MVYVAPRYFQDRVKAILQETWTTPAYMPAAWGDVLAIRRSPLGERDHGRRALAATPPCVRSGSSETRALSRSSQAGEHLSPSIADQIRRPWITSSGCGQPP